MDESKSAEKPKKKTDNKVSKGLQLFIQEIVARYERMPLLPFTDVTMNDDGRIFHMKKPSSDSSEKFDIVLFEPMHNCKRCYGMGYVALFESNDPQYGGQPLLNLCSCLHEVKNESKDA